MLLWGLQSLFYLLRQMQTPAQSPKAGEQPQSERNGPPFGKDIPCGGNQRQGFVQAFV